MSTMSTSFNVVRPLANEGVCHKSVNRFAKNLSANVVRLCDR